MVLKSKRTQKLKKISLLVNFKDFKYFFQILTGVGFAIGVSCMIQSIVDMSVITWSAQAFYLLFTGQVFTENFFYGQVLDVQDDLSLDNLGVLHGQLSLCLGIGCLVIFILIAAGTRSLGKVVIRSALLWKVKDQCKQEAFRAPFFAVNISLKIPECTFSPAAASLNFLLKTIAISKQKPGFFQ